MDRNLHESLSSVGGEYIDDIIVLACNLCTIIPKSFFHKLREKNTYTRSTRDLNVLGIGKKAHMRTLGLVMINERQKLRVQATHQEIMFRMGYIIKVIDRQGGRFLSSLISVDD